MMRCPRAAARLRMRHKTDISEAAALLALFAGALALGTSGIFVRWSQTGPTATAFWRGALALPVLALWAYLERRRIVAAGAKPASLRDPMFLWAGVFFAGDLALWHTSLLLTSIAASTLEANCAPMLVTLAAWALWGERPRPGFLLALALAFGGMLLILVPKLGAGSHALTGDALGLATACFYAGYILAVARLRTRHGTGIVMFASTLVFSLLLLPLALMQKFLPLDAHGWWVLIACALSAQALGQSLIAYALARLPASFSAVGLYVAVVAAAGYAWLLLGERLAPVQILGGVVVLAAIALARNTRRPAAAAPEAAAPQPPRASIQSSTPRQSESR
jgi:drug/metabolite transporter (DMT)-like permease